MRMALIAAMALGACTTPGETVDAPAAPPPPADGTSTPAEPDPFQRACDAAGTSVLVGRPASTGVGAEALRLSGARTLRWIRPGDAVTMDFRTDRANVELDAGGRVTRVRCG